MAMSQTELLTYCANFTLSYTHSAEDEALKQLQTSAATRLINLLRMCRLQRAVLAVGMFSMFEAALQSQCGWKDPFPQLDKYLHDAEKHDLAQLISDYQLAINALKHGQGPSHTRLLKRADKLEFKVRPPDQFFDEGDVSEVAILVDVDDKFVRRCAELIGLVSDTLGADLG